MWLMPVPYSDPRPFVWFPLAGLRHAIKLQDRDVPPGGLMHCLCGATHPRGLDGDMEWLWTTCQPCWDKTCTLIGLRPRQ